MRLLCIMCMCFVHGSRIIIERHIILQYLGVNQLNRNTGIAFILAFFNSWFSLAERM